MGLAQERGSLGISLDGGCIILPFFVGTALAYSIPREVVPLWEKIKLVWIRLCPSSGLAWKAVCNLCTPKQRGWVCKTPGISSCSQFLQ